MKIYYVYYIILLIIFFNLNDSFSFNMDMTYTLKTRICNKLKVVSKCNCSEERKFKNKINSDNENDLLDEKNDETNNQYNCNLSI